MFSDQRYTVESMNRKDLSRENWKKKAMDRGQTIRNKNRQEKAREAYISKIESKLQQAEEKIRALEAMQKKGLPDTGVYSRSAVIFLCVNIYLFGRISFSSIPRVLSQLSLGSWIPSPKGIRDWVCKLGLRNLNIARKHSGDWLAIVDISIDIAYKKVLMVLRVPVEALATGTAMTLKDVMCVGLEVKESWNGESIHEALGRTFGDATGLLAVIKDGGTDLEKGVRLWRNDHKAKGLPTVFIISDISHFVANLLKAEFSKQLNFSDISGTVKGCLSKLYQSKFSFLAPPKIRTKARFMSISRLARWFDRMREVLGGPGRAPHGSLLEELRSIVGGLGPMSYILDKFSAACLTLTEAMEILKNRGLNPSTYCEVMKIVETLPIRSKARINFERWLNTHLAIQKRLSIGQSGLLVTSDIIEMLFGVYKDMVARSSKAELTRSILCIPALCGTITDEKIRESRESITHKDLDQWTKSHIGVTNATKRKRFFDGHGLEEILQKAGKAAA